MLLCVTLAYALFLQAMTAEDARSAVRSETLLRSSSSWGNEPYKSYPPGQPELSVLKITLQPHTKLEWHSPIPSAAYNVAGELMVERKKDGKKQHFVAGQAVSETVGTFHRGVAGNEPVVLTVFYAGTPGLPLTQSAARKKTGGACKNGLVEPQREESECGYVSKPKRDAGRL